MFCVLERVICTIFKGQLFICVFCDHENVARGVSCNLATNIIYPDFNFISVSDHYFFICNYYTHTTKKRGYTVLAVLSSVRYQYFLSCFFQQSCITATSNLEKACWKLYGIEKKCWKSPFSPFPIMFSLLSKMSAVIWLMFVFVCKLKYLSIGICLQFLIIVW